MKKVFIWVMTFAMLLSLCPVMSISAGVVKSGDYTYTVSDDKATITKYSGSGGEVTIPSKLDGYPVTAIGKSAFFSCNNLTTVTIGDSVTAIGNYAFYDCSELTAVTIGDSVTAIGNYAFAACSSLTDIAVDDNNPSYSAESGVLFSKDKKTLLCYPAASGEYRVPDSVTTIGESAFACCNSLTTVTIPVSVKVIEELAFSGVSFANVIFEGDVMPIMYKDSFKDNISEDKLDPSVTVDIIGFKNGKKIEDEIWTGELLKPVVTGYTGSDELYYRFETNNSAVNEYLGFYTSDMERVYDGDNYFYLPGEAYAAIMAGESPSQITCSVYTAKKEDGGTFSVSRIAFKKVTLTTGSGGNFIANATKANEKEFAQNNVVLMQQGDSTTLVELLSKAGFTHTTCSVAYMADITTSNYGENELTVNEITGGDRETVITASETETGLSKLTFKFWSDRCTYHGTSYSERAPLKVTMYIYVVGKPGFQTTSNSITVIDNTESDATSTYQIGLDTPKTAPDLTFTGLKENTEYDILQTLTVEIEGEAYTGVYHNYTRTKAKITVDVPTAETGLVYDGTEQTGVILPDDAVYTLTGNTGTDAGNYTATATLKDNANYAWNVAESTAADQTIDWSIAKYESNTITGLTCADIRRGGTPTPTAKAAFGEIVYTYSKDGETWGMWEEANRGSGTYQVKATIAETDNYNGCESDPVTFRVISSSSGGGSPSSTVKTEKEAEPVPTVNSNPFTDVKESDFFYAPVLWAVDKGITSGVTATTFCPYDITTRAQMVTFLWRAAGSPEPVSAKNPFVDVKEGDYFYKAVLWGYENVYVKGTSETTFDPDLTVTRGQAVTFLARMAGVTDEATGYTHFFTDVPADAYYNNSIAWASRKGIANGIDENSFAPDQGCKRGEVVTFLYRNANQ